MPSRKNYAKKTSIPVQPLEAQKPPKQRQSRVARRNGRVEEFKTIARPIAAFYASCTPEPFDDLLQVGLMGLMRAAELYQPSKSTPFGAYAKPHVRGAILHYLRDTAPLIRLPRRIAELQQQAKREGEKVTSGLVLTPGQRKAIEELEVWSRPISLDQLPFEELDFVAPSTESGGIEPEGSVSAVAMGALRGLDSQLQWIVSKVVLEGWTYRRTAAHLEVSPMTVQRRLKAGLAKVRAALELREATVGASWRPSRFVVEGC